MEEVQHMGLIITVAVLAVLLSVIGALFARSVKRYGERITELEKELEYFRKELLEVPVLKRELELQKEEKSALHNQKEMLLSQISTLQNEHARLEVEYKNIKEKYEALQRDNVKLQNDLQAAETTGREFEVSFLELSTKLTTAHEEIERLDETLSEQKKHLESMQEQKEKLLKENATLTSQLDAIKATNEKLQKEFAEQSKKLELKLSEIMQKTLDKKIEKFDANSAKSLENILKPFKQNIESFQKKVEESQEKSTKRFAELSKEIELLAKSSAMISAEAQNLTEALKGKKQTTGAWGEMILESVLEYSGLLRGEHYEKQASYKDESGSTKKPDVVVKLPQRRFVIIDSKVSLVHYDEYVRAEGDEAKNIAAKQLARDFKNQIDNLVSKDYTHYDVGTLQYVFMFVPVEGAFSTALHADPSLYEYALRQHIAIVTPSTLTVSLRTIYLYWQSERSSEYAQKLFIEAGKLYDKLVLFSESFERLGSQLGTLQNTYEEAHKRLASGSGNVLKRATNLKALGAKTTKDLKKTKIEYDDFDEESIEVELLEEKKENADDTDV